MLPAMSHGVLVRIVAAAWAVPVLVWVVSWLFAKRVGRRMSRRGWAFEVVWRLAVVAAFVLVLRKPSLRGLLWWTFPTALQVIGTTFAVLGAGLAVWARVSLGRNWGTPQTLKKEPELVTRGPYAVIRHPIYAAILLAFVGSSLVFGPVWLIPFAGISASFVRSAFVEEKLLRERLPEAYPAYMARTKRLIPFVW